MKLLASLALGMATFLVATFGFVAPAAAGDDDVSIGVKLGPLCVGLCIDGGGDRHGRRHHRYERDNADYDGGFYANREDYYHQRYDRRPYPDYAEARDDGYAGYRRHNRNGGHDRHGRRGRHHDDGDDYGGSGGDDEDDDGGED